jgi:hypothetical protein
MIVQCGVWITLDGLCLLVDRRLWRVAMVFDQAYAMSFFALSELLWSSWRDSQAVWT